PPNRAWPSNHKPALDNNSPIKMISARPSRPNLSLIKPANRTETPPKSGKSALLLAASDLLKPTTSVKYVGVQVLKVSRNSVVPNDNTQTIQNAGLRRNAASAPFNAACPDASCSLTKLSGLACGSVSPISRGDSLSNNRLTMKMPNITPAAAKKTPRQPTPWPINHPINPRAAASPKR